MPRLGLALASIGLGLATAALVACSGDDTDTPLPDAGTDATVARDGSTDATAETDGKASSDAGSLDAGALDGAACTPFDAAAYTDAEVQSGLAIVIARKCEGCHGQQLQGSSNPLPSSADGGFAYPLDLTPDPITGLGCWTDGEIERAFLHGIDKAGAPLCDPMPKFGEKGSSSIDDAGAAAVVAYLRRIPAVANPNIPKTPACYPPPVVDSGVDAGVDASIDAGDAAVADGGPDAQPVGPEDAGDATAPVDASDDGG